LGQNLINIVEYVGENLLLKMLLLDYWNIKPHQR